MGPLEFLYYIGYSLKKSLSLKARERLPSEVISIGNITAGGTGKTPAVIALAERAMDSGFLPCILTRGYGGKAKGPCLVSTTNGSALSAEEAGDEALLMATRLRSVPIVKGKNRYEAGLFALDHLKKEAMDLEKRTIFILDDGFQHRRLGRDLDIVLDSPEEKIALREPRSSLKRADICLLKDKDYSVVSRGFFSPWDKQKIAAETLAKKRALAFCGIARPQRFFAQVREEGLDLVLAMSFPDHHAYPPSSLRKILRAYRESGAEIFLTTEKDSVKIESQSSFFGNIPVYYLKIGLRIIPEVDERMRRLLEKAARS